MRLERASDGVSAELNDAALIKQSLERPQAFASIFDRHFDAVHGYARRRLGRSLAEEVASETFIRAFDRRASSTVRVSTRVPGSSASPPT
jgi:DNA-directed RNA polymerase specialized sigma24 family protein